MNIHTIETTTFHIENKYQNMTLGRLKYGLMFYF